jgi:hypothetical protein
MCLEQLRKTTRVTYKRLRFEILTAEQVPMPVDFQDTDSKIQIARYRYQDTDKDAESVFLLSVGACMRRYNPEQHCHNYYKVSKPF